MQMTFGRKKVESVELNGKCPFVMAIHILVSVFFLISFNVKFYLYYAIAKAAVEEKYPQNTELMGNGNQTKPCKAGGMK